MKKKIIECDYCRKPVSPLTMRYSKKAHGLACSDLCKRILDASYTTSLGANSSTAIPQMYSKKVIH